MAPDTVRATAAGWLLCHATHVRVGARGGVAAVVTATGLVR